MGVITAHLLEQLQSQSIRLPPGGARLKRGRTRAAAARASTRKSSFMIMNNRLREGRRGLQREVPRFLTCPPTPVEMRREESSPRVGKGHSSLAHGLYPRDNGAYPRAIPIDPDGNDR
jgi:hypothetical protein